MKSGRVSNYGHPIILNPTAETWDLVTATETPYGGFYSTGRKPKRKIYSYRRQNLPTPINAWWMSSSTSPSCNLDHGPKLHQGRLLKHKGERDYNVLKGKGTGVEKQWEGSIEVSRRAREPHIKAREEENTRESKQARRKVRGRQTSNPLEDKAEHRHDALRYPIGRQIRGGRRCWTCSTPSPKYFKCQRNRKGVVKRSGW